MSLLVANGSTSTIGLSLNAQPKSELHVNEVKIKREPRYFQEYILRVIDLRWSEQPNHNRIKFEIRENVELLPGQYLRDLAILKHGPEIQNVDEFELMTIEVDLVKSWVIKD